MSLKVSSNQIPVYYQFQNREDKATNVYLIPFQQDIKVKHVLKKFPMQDQLENFHFRFKIQCEKPQKQLAWLDITNMNAKAPIINGAVHIKILELKKGLKSKIYNTQKIQSLKNDQTANNEQKKQNILNQDQINEQKEREFRKQQELAQYSNQKDKNWNQEKNDINQQNDYIDNQQKNNHDVYDVSPKNTPVQSQNSNEDEIQADDWGLGENQAEQNNQTTYQQNFQKSNNSTGNMHQGGDLWGDEPQQQSGHSILSNQSNSNSQQYQFDSTESGNFVIINGQKVSREELQKQKLDLIEKNKNDKIKDLQDSIQGEKDKKNKRLEMGPIWKEKVNAWAYKDKQRQNIRKLLASVHEILWKDCDWTPLQLHDLLDDNSVKKAYYKSLLKIHPDKNRGKGAEIEYLAESIIHEIKEGWDEYKNNNN